MAALSRLCIKLRHYPTPGHTAPSRVQQNLAEEFAALHLLLRGGGILQPEFGIDDCSHLAQPNEFQRIEKFPLASHEGTENRALPAEEALAVQLQICARGHAAGHQAPIR